MSKVVLKGIIKVIKNSNFNLVQESLGEINKFEFERNGELLKLNIIIDEDNILIIKRGSENITIEINWKELNNISEEILEEKLSKLLNDLLINSKPLKPLNEPLNLKPLNNNPLREEEFINRNPYSSEASPLLREPFQIGRGDIFPDHLNNSGMMIGPNHPGWSRGGLQRGGLQRGRFQRGRIPGARWDPVFPFNNEPNPDHFNPPGFYGGFI